MRAARPCGFCATHPGVRKRGKPRTTDARAPPASLGDRIGGLSLGMDRREIDRYSRWPWVVQTGPESVTCAARDPTFGPIEQGMSHCTLSATGRVALHVACSAHYCGPTVDPDSRGGAETAPRIAQVLESTRALVREIFPDLDSEHGPSTMVKCLYTITADHDFVLGCHPSRPRVYWMGGGSGHAFKFGPALGEMAACALLDEALPFALPAGKFDPDRFEKKYGALACAGSA